MMMTSTAAVPAPAAAYAPGDVLRYFAGAYAITWLAWGAAALTTRGVFALPVPDFALLVLGGLGPMLAAILVTARESGRAGVRALFGQLGRARVRLAWYLAALGLVPLLRLVPVAAHLATGGAWPAGEVRDQLAALPFFFVFVALVGGGLDEEMGWRGFALPRLQQLADPVRANLILGGVWACWHLPLWFIPGTDQAALSFPLYLVSTTALSFVLGAIYNGTGGSLLLAILAHTASNVADNLRATVLRTNTDPARDLAFQVVLTGVMVVAAAVVAARTRGALSSARPAGEGVAPWRER